MMMTQGLIGSLPMTMSPAFHGDLGRMKRVTTKTSANAVHLAPLVAEWQGTGTPVLLLGRRGQVMQIDVYDNPAGNYNVAIAGTSGSESHCCSTRSPPPISAPALASGSSTSAARTRRPAATSAAASSSSPRTPACR
jgi:hypothetical protein